MTGLFCCVCEIRLDIDDEMLYIDHVIRNGPKPNMNRTIEFRIKFEVMALVAMMIIVYLLLS